MYADYQHTRRAKLVVEPTAQFSPVAGFPSTCYGIRILEFRFSLSKKQLAKQNLSLCIYDFQSVINKTWSHYKSQTPSTGVVRNPAAVKQVETPYLDLTP